MQQKNPTKIERGQTLSSLIVGLMLDIGSKEIPNFLEDLQTKEIIYRCTLRFSEDYLRKIYDTIPFPSEQKPEFKIVFNEMTKISDKEPNGFWVLPHKNVRYLRTTEIDVQPIVRRTEREFLKMCPRREKKDFKFKSADFLKKMKTHGSTLTAAIEKERNAKNKRKKRSPRVQISDLAPYILLGTIIKKSVKHYPNSSVFIEQLRTGVLLEDLTVTVSELGENLTLIPAREKKKNAFELAINHLVKIGILNVDKTTLTFRNIIPKIIFLNVPGITISKGHLQIAQHKSYLDYDKNTGIRKELESLITQIYSALSLPNSQSVPTPSPKKHKTENPTLAGENLSKSPQPPFGAQRSILLAPPPATESSPDIFEGLDDLVAVPPMSGRNLPTLPLSSEAAPIQPPRDQSIFPITFKNVKRK